MVVVPASFLDGLHAADLEVDDEPLQIMPAPDPRHPVHCGGCQQAGQAAHEYCRRQIRDLPMPGKAARLQVMQWPSDLLPGLLFTGSTLSQVMEEEIKHWTARRKPALLTEKEPSFGYRTVAGLLGMNKKAVQ